VTLPPPPPPNLPPWYRPTAIQPTLTPRRKPRPGLLIPVVVLLVVGLCAGGLTVLGRAFGGGSDGPAVVVAASEPAGLVAAVPSPSPSSALPSPSVTPSPSVKPSLRAKPKAITKKPKPRPTKKPKPKPTTVAPKPPAPTTAPTQTGVRPGAACSPEGAFGRTNRGTLLRCTERGREDGPHWHRVR
jgi:hypothetical protein